MLTCRQITELATDHAEGVLDAATGRSFASHLAACDGCRVWVTQLELAVRAVRALPPPALARGLGDLYLRRSGPWRSRWGLA